MIPGWQIYKFLYINKIKAFKKSINRKPKILFLENQTAVHSGAHYRVEIVKKRLEQDGFKVRVCYPFSLKQYEKSKLDLYDTYLMFPKKLFHIVLASRYDIVVVRRELLHHCNYGGLLFERLLCAINDHVILDMDDYIPDFREKSRSRSLFNTINLFHCGKATDVFNLYKYYSVCDQSFIDSIRTDAPDCRILAYHIFPMCVDYKQSNLKDYHQTNATKKVGWVSQAANFSRIDNIVQYLNRVYEKTPFELIVVADIPYQNSLLKAPIVNFKWSIENEVEYIRSFDIGISPLFFSKSKKNRIGTFKLVQYMSLGLVTLTTAVPYIQKQVTDCDNGFLVFDTEQWQKKLNKLLSLSNDELSEIGKKAAASVYSNHHIDTQYPKLRDFYLKIIQL